MTSTTKTFEVGTTYTCRSICDHECVWSYTVISRTNSTITVLQREGGRKTLRISRKLTNALGVECVQPMGSYSMAPVLRAA